MNSLVEVLLGTLLILLVVGQPRTLQRYTRTGLGKVLFLAVTIGAGYYSLYAGVLVALIYMSLHKDFMLIESMENKDEAEDELDIGADADSDTDADADAHEHADSKGDFVKKYCKDGKLDDASNPPTLKYTKGKCNPCDDDCEFEITSAKERMTVDEALRPKESNAIPV